MRWIARLIRSLASPLLLLGLTLIFCWPLLTPAPGEGWWSLDANWHFYPFGRYVATALKESRLPLWNSHLFLGFPFLAEPQSMVFYPVTWLSIRWPVGKVLGWSLTLHFWLAALGMYALVRNLGGRKQGALLSGVVFAFSGFATSRLYGGHYPVLMTWTWLPWMLAAFHWAYRRRSLAGAILAGIPVGLGALAGSPPIWSLTLLALGLLALYLSHRGTDWQRRILVLAQFGLMLLSGVLLAGAQLLPTLQLTMQSSRVTQLSYEFFSEAHMPVEYLLTLLAPDLLGSPAESVGFWAASVIPYWESCFYVGISSLLLILLFRPRGDWRWRFFLPLGGGALLVSLGQAGAIHPLLYRFLPGFGLFRVPARAGMLFVLAAATLSGLALDRCLALSLEERASQLAGVKRYILLASGVALAVALLAILLGAVQQGNEIVQRVLLIANQATRFSLLLAGSYALLRLPGQGAHRVILVLILVLIDLWGFGSKYLIVKPFEPPQLGWIMADLALPPERHTYRILPILRVRDRNEPLTFSFLSTDGYDPFTVGDADVLRDLAHQRSDRILDLLSVRYLMVAEEDVPDTPVTGWNVVTQPAGAHFYERDHVGPRAFVVHGYELAADHDDALERLLAPTLDPYTTAVLESPADCAWESLPAGVPPETATILGYEQERVTLEVEAAAGGMLILGDLYYPGWQAEVDGQPVPVHRTDYALRGVCVPAGRHRVVFTFDPPIVRQGIIVSKIGLGVILMAALWAGWEAIQSRWRFGQEVER